jgi:hypothetical protein
MDNWTYSSPDRKAYVVLAYITCENVVLLTTKPEILREKAQTINLFLPTVYVLCEKGKRIAEGFRKSGIGSATALWISLSISDTCCGT